MSAKLFVEGGGDSKTLKTACRKGFRLFIEKAGLRGRMPRIVACGSRRNAYQDFTRENESPARQDGNPHLLVDSEEPVREAGPWQHLKVRDGWDRPDGAMDDQCHLMVEVMESWFLADREALGAFYGQGFRGTALPQNQHVEQISKRDVLYDLVQATRRTRKGPYDKGSHGFEILARLDPSKVRNASPHADRFLEALSVLVDS